MTNKNPVNYQVEDFISDDSFANYYFRQKDTDVQYWEKWLKEHPEKTSIAEAAIKILETLKLHLPRTEFEQELSKLKANINYNDHGHGTGGSIDDSTGVDIKIHRYLKYLIPSVAFVLITGYFLFPSFPSNGIKIIEKINHSKTPVVLILPDSTVITLAPNAVLKYPTEFDNNERRVDLSGEAQFNVRSDKKRPFKVYSGEIVATVLGTIFNFKRQPGDTVIQVELIQGKLKVESLDDARSSKQSILLEPDQRVTYNSKTMKLKIETWQSNSKPVKFKKDDFNAIAKELKSVFGKTVVNLSDKKNWLFTGEFEDQSAEEIVENICMIKKLSYSLKGDSILIHNAKH